MLGDMQVRAGFEIGRLSCSKVTAGENCQQLPGLDLLTEVCMHGHDATAHDGGDLRQGMLIGSNNPLEIAEPAEFTSDSRGDGKV